MASQKLKNTADIVALCRRSGATLRKEAEKEIISLDYLGQTCHVILPDVDVSTASGETLSPRDKLIILHYLNTADGAEPTGRLITFQEIPEGAIYFPTFRKRSVIPLLDKFAHSPGALIAIAESLGGKRADSGELSFTLRALPRVLLTVTLWPGDEELPDEGNILFDSSVVDYLPTEDITVLCEILAWKLIKRA
jgi:hypothetical protein